ncbi:hypothetical protein LTR70_006277 [Exophiala xenobiotica]|nr:hypothetical protein LTR70_006277 [Exophiala xenobiotica]
MFVESLHSALAVSRLLSVVYLGASAASVAPHGWAVLAGTVTQVIVGAAMKHQRRKRSHSYLDQINEQLFKLRGLYAVVMTYVPNAQRPVTSKQVNMNDLLAGKKRYNTSILGPKLVEEESYGELELPDSASLVFPGVDKVAKAQLLGENAMKRAARWTAEHVDR